MSNPPNPAATQQPESGADALSRLHKMSRTAGVGTQDYVAINVVAITALLFSLASPLVFIFEWTLLIIPAAAIVLAIVAIRQIVGSNGTQTGKGLAIVALLIAAGSSGLYITQQTLAMTRSRSDEQQISAVIEQVGASLAKRDFVSAYSNFSAKFKADTTAEDFQQKWNILLNSPAYGPIKQMQGNQNVGFDKEGDGTFIAATYAIIKREKIRQDDRQLVKLRKVSDHWLLDTFGDYFQQAPPPIPAGAAGPGGGGQR